MSSEVITNQGYKQFVNNEIHGNLDKTLLYVCNFYIPISHFTRPFLYHVSMNLLCSTAFIHFFTSRLLETINSQEVLANADSTSFVFVISLFVISRLLLV